MSVDARSWLIRSQIRRYRRIFEAITLTYWDTRHADGAGAQLHRVYGIYALSRLLGAKYRHTPLADIGYQGLAALESNRGSAEIVERYNKLFRIPSDPGTRDPSDQAEVLEVEWFRLGETAAALERNRRLRQIRILYPFKCVDRVRGAWNVIGEVSPFQTDAGDPVRIALHVRRGELHVVDSDRMLPNAYYIAAARRAAEVLEGLGIDYRFELYTETLGNPITVSPDSHGILGRIDDDVVVDPRDDRLEDFERLAPLDRYVNTDPIDALSRMATANILITSRSSFSYVAAALNPRGVVLYHPFWHPPKRDWIPTTDAGSFSRRRLRSTIRRCFC
jgi:hypothetical protein